MRRNRALNGTPLQSYTVPPDTSEHMVLSLPTLEGWKT